MTIHLYFSLLHAALMASMLAPEQFGQYFATGHRCESKGQATFLEVDPAFHHPSFNIDEALALCVPRTDGAPKNSVHISMHRVLAQSPLARRTCST